MQAGLTCVQADTAGYALPCFHAIKDLAQRRCCIEIFNEQLQAPPAGQPDAARRRRVDTVLDQCGRLLLKLATQCTLHQIIFDTATGYRSDEAAVVFDNHQCTRPPGCRAPGAGHRNQGHSRTFVQPVNSRMQDFAVGAAIHQFSRRIGRLRAGLPSTSTTQEPQSAILQRYLAPVSLRPSGNTQSNGVSGSITTPWLLPLTLSCNMIASSM